MVKTARVLGSLLTILLLRSSSMNAESSYLEQMETVRETPQSLLFGINMVANPHILHYPEGYDESVYKTLERIGGTMVRLCASPRDIEPVHGKRDWSKFEAKVDMALRHGIEPMMLICNTPAWALPVEQIPGYDEVRDWPEEKRYEWLGKFTHQYPYRTDLFPEFADFCRDLATRMKGKIRLYQLWNEPNGCSWHFHDGYNHADEYVPFLAAAYDPIKDVDPDALLLMGSLDDKDGWAHIFLNMYYDIRDKDYAGRRLCDGITVHPYDNDIANKKRKLHRLRDIMVKNGDADLPVFITEYGWRTGDSGDHKKQEWLRQTLKMFQEPDMEFLKGSIHLSLSDFEGEPGFGLTDENLRPRESFFVFQGTPRFGASPPHTIQWRPISQKEIEVTWETVLPAESVFACGEVVGEEPAPRHLREYRTPVGTRHRVSIESPRGNCTYVFRIGTKTGGEGKTYTTSEQRFYVPGFDVTNGDFTGGFFAGIANGWRIEGDGLCTDAAVFPGIEMKSGEHAQVVFAVPERSIGLNSTASTWVATQPNTRYRMKVSAADASYESDAKVQARIGIDPTGAGRANEETISWSDWVELEDGWKEIGVDTVSGGTLAAVLVQIKAQSIGEKGRPAAAFDRVRFEPL